MPGQPAPFLPVCLHLVTSPCPLVSSFLSSSSCQVYLGWFGLLWRTSVVEAWGSVLTWLLLPSQFLQGSHLSQSCQLHLSAPPVSQPRPHPRSSLTASHPQPQARVSTVGHLKRHGSPAEFLTSPRQHWGLGNSGGKPRNPPCLLPFPHTCLHPSIESSCLNFPESRQLSNPSFLAPPKPTCGLPSRRTEKVGPRGSQRCSPAYLCSPVCHHTLLPCTVAVLTSLSCLKLLLGAEPPYRRVPSPLPSIQSVSSIPFPQASAHCLPRLPPPRSRKSSPFHPNHSLSPYLASSFFLIPLT